MSKTLCVDFDGVLHAYTSGWQGGARVTDGPVPGAMEWLYAMVGHGYDVSVFSTRSSTDEGIFAMQSAIKHWMAHWLHNVGLDGDSLVPMTLCESMAGGIVNSLHFPRAKPAAWLTIDDRALCFRGEFPSIETIESFRPWNKPAPEEPGEVMRSDT